MIESQTIAMAQKSRMLISQGRDVISLSLGEPDFDTPEHIRDAAKKAIDDRYSHYPPVAGYQDLKETICAKLKRDNDLDFAPNQIVTSTGAKQSIVNVLLSILNQGDEVILPAPYWVSYHSMINIAGGVPKIIQSDVSGDFKVSPEQIEQAITQKTKAFLFSSPCNPTGTVYSKEELRAFAAVFSKFPNVLIISDEIYEYINFRGSHNSIAQFKEVKEQTVIINGLSKGFAMTGWRLGYMAGPESLAATCTKLQGQFTSGTNVISQRAAITALSSSLESTFAMREAFRRRRDFIYEELSTWEGLKPNYPEGAFYIFPDVSAFFGLRFDNFEVNNATDLCMYLLEDANVALVTGDAFGSPNCLRISFAENDDKLKEAMSRVKRALYKLK